MSYDPDERFSLHPMEGEDVLRLLQAAEAAEDEGPDEDPAEDENIRTE